MRPCIRIFCTALLVLGMTAATALAADFPRMSADELKAQLDSDDVLVVDVRSATDWKGSEFKIPGSIHGDPGNVDAWVGQLPEGKTLVTVCA